MCRIRVAPHLSQQRVDAQPLIEVDPVQESHAFGDPRTRSTGPQCDGDDARQGRQHDVQRREADPGHNHMVRFDQHEGPTELGLYGEGGEDLHAEGQGRRQTPDEEGAAPLGSRFPPVILQSRECGVRQTINLETRTPSVSLDEVYPAMHDTRWRRSRESGERHTVKIRGAE